ncbi:hypothetical protein CRUP_025812 [Coryphaenoides rupestris]|nr:hypothetical protein CRUP_025812 [Coryphaenoides rupestris]
MEHQRLAAATISASRADRADRADRLRVQDVGCSPLVASRGAIRGPDEWTAAGSGVSGARRRDPVDNPGVSVGYLRPATAIARLIMQSSHNWAGMRCPYKLLRMILALVCMSSEVGRAVWLRFSPPLPSSGPQPSFMAHLSGAVVGISMGLLILRSYEESLQRQCSWWVVVFSFITFLLFAIFWNIFAYELLGVQIPPPP